MTNLVGEVAFTEDSFDSVAGKCGNPGKILSRVFSQSRRKPRSIFENLFLYHGKTIDRCFAYPFNDR